MEEMGTKISNTEYFVLKYSSISPQGRTAQIRGCLLVLPRMGANKSSWKRRELKDQAEGRRLFWGENRCKDSVSSHQIELIKLNRKKKGKKAERREGR